MDRICHTHLVMGRSRIRIVDIANLAPRAGKINRRYASEFGTRFTSLKLKRIIPFIY